MATNPISDVTFGQERTARQMRDRAQWERDQAARLRAEMRDRPASEVMVGQEHVAQAHEDTARAYEQAARKREHEESGVQPKRSHAATKKTASSAPSTFTIVRMRGNEVSFWTGRRWTKEFPDAGEADSLPLAYAAFASAQDRSFTEGDEISIVENYGLDSERTVRHIVKDSRSHATKKSSRRGKRSHATKAPSASKTFYAAEFDLAKGERTGLVMEFVAEDLQEATQHLVYTLNLKSKGWKVSPSGKTVQKMTGDIGWHLVRAGTPAASHMGLD